MMNNKSGDQNLALAQCYSAIFDVAFDIEFLIWSRLFP